MLVLNATNPDIIPGNVLIIMSQILLHFIVTIVAKPDTFPGNVRIKKPEENVTIVTKPDICLKIAEKKMAQIQKCCVTIGKFRMI